MAFKNQAAEKADRMRSFTRSPFFYLSFFVLSALIHYLLIMTEACGISAPSEVVQLFIAQSVSANLKPFAAGPLTFSYYKLFASFFSSPAMAFNMGSALLGATLTYTILRIIFLLKATPPLMYLVGTWTLISPGMLFLSLHHPHLLLGIAFLLLLISSLIRKNWVLMVVFVVHLFLTHPLMGVLSLVLITASLIRRKKVVAWLPSSKSSR